MKKPTKSIRAWIARDKEGEIALFLGKPVKYFGHWWCRCHCEIYLEPDSFPDVKYEDKEATTVRISLINK